MSDGKFNPFLHDDDASGSADGEPTVTPDLAEAVKTAMALTEHISEADTRYSEAAIMAVRMAGIGNHLLDTVAAEHGITIENSPEEGGYAMRAITAASPEQLAAALQALNQAHDMALYAFLEAYKTLQMLLSHPQVELQIAGISTIKRIDTKQAKRKMDLMVQLQSPKERKRAELLAHGLTQIERMARDMGKDDVAMQARVGAVTSALYAQVNEAIKDLPSTSGSQEEQEDAAHG